MNPTTATIPSANSTGAPYVAGNFAPLRSEVTSFDLEVIGHLGKTRQGADVVELLQGCKAALNHELGDLRRHARCLDALPQGVVELQLVVEQDKSIVPIRQANIDLRVQAELIDIFRPFLRRVKHPVPGVVFMDVDLGRF